MDIKHLYLSLEKYNKQSSTGTIEKRICLEFSHPLEDYYKDKAITFFIYRGFDVAGRSNKRITLRQTLENQNVTKIEILLTEPDVLNKRAYKCYSIANPSQFNTILSRLLAYEPIVKVEYSKDDKREEKIIMKSNKKHKTKKLKTLLFGQKVQYHVNKDKKTVVCYFCTNENPANTCLYNILRDHLDNFDYIFTDTIIDDIHTVAKNTARDFPDLSAIVTCDARDTFSEKIGCELAYNKLRKRVYRAIDHASYKFYEKVRLRFDQFSNKLLKNKKEK